MKYAYTVDKDGNVTFTSGEHVVFWKELTEEQHNLYIKARHEKNQVIYQDEKGNLQTRDKDTIFDEKTKKWIPDVKGIRYKANQATIIQASQAYQRDNLDRHQFSKLSVKQQDELSKYLDKLLDIINVKESLDYDLKLPSRPDFLGK